MMKPRLVLYPITCHEDEAVEHHARTDEGNVFQRLFKNDVDVTMHFTRICHPPKVKPFSVNLMIRNHDQPFWEESLESSILRLQQLSPNALVPTDSYDRRTEPGSRCSGDKPKRLLGKCHVSVVKVLVDEVERPAKNLGAMYGKDTSIKP